MLNITMVRLFLAILLAAPASAEVDFARDVHPILTSRCAACHTGDKAQAGLDLNTRAEVVRSVVPGKSAASLLIQRVTGEKGPRMPLRGNALTAGEIDILKRWIDEGALGPRVAEAVRWIAPLEPRKPAVPPGIGHPIDALLATKGAVVDDAVFARRVWLDLWGLLPTPEELQVFTNDRSPDKRARLIDRLLSNNTNYAAHWISFYNDLLRNDEGVVYYGERKTIGAWLRKSLEANLPYDRFVSTLINPLAKDDPEGFILGITWRGEVPASERPPLQAAQNSAQAFLGINLKCNSCHDSFISNWKLHDAYGLASFFSPEPLEMVRCDVKTGRIAKPKFLYPELGEVKTEGTLEERRAEAARMFTLPANGRLRRTLVNRYWKQLFGRGIVEPVDDMSAEPWNADLLDWLASDFADHGHDMKYLLRLIMTSRAYQLPSLLDVPPRTGERYTFRGPHKRRLTAEQFADAVASLTGEWRLKTSPKAEPARYVRDWELKNSSLTRALGRPIRDQVVTERLVAPTTLQSLELVNGSTLAEWLREGARRLVEMPAAPPDNLFDSGVIRRNAVKADVNLKGISKLWLIIENVDSYDPPRVVPMWKDAVLVKGSTETPLAELLPGIDLAKLKLPSKLIVDLGGKHFERLHAVAEVTTESKISEIGPAIRYFIFDREPDPKRMIRIEKGTPVEMHHKRFTPERLVSVIYRHALQRDPTAAERTVASEILGKELTVDATEDFLWMILMSPEFQYIR